jgi:hypothetical protein
MTLDASGNVLPMPAWFSPLALGEYDIVVDVNGNGRYDQTIDASDDNQVQITAGFVVPEFPSSIVLSLFMIATLLAVSIECKRFC